MARANLTLWRNAQRDAALILGDVAEKDPAAWWCLVELLISYAQGRKA